MPRGTGSGAFTLQRSGPVAITTRGGGLACAAVCLLRVDAGAVPEYRAAARRLGELLAGRGRPVFGAGHVGLMGVLADAVLAAAARRSASSPGRWSTRSWPTRGLTELRVVETMHRRKALMADLADAFAALPGGYGTADELFEILTWAQLGLHAKPIGLLNVAGFFDPLLAWVDHCVAKASFARAPRITADFERF